MTYYLVTFIDGSQGIFTAEEVAWLSWGDPGSILSVVPYTPPVPEPPTPPPPTPPTPPTPPAYTPCIIGIVAPSNAEQGKTVDLSVTLTNVNPDTYSYRLEVQVVPDKYSAYIIKTSDKSIPGGDSRTVTTSFTMPDCNVTILAWVERWTGSYWAYDSSTSRVITLKVVTYKGSIYKKELEYDESRATIPVY